MQYGQTDAKKTRQSRTLRSLAAALTVAFVSFPFDTAIYIHTVAFVSFPFDTTIYIHTVTLVSFPPCPTTQLLADSRRSSDRPLPSLSPQTASENSHWQVDGSRIQTALVALRRRRSSACCSRVALAAAREGRAGARNADRAGFTTKHARLWQRQG